VTLAEIAAHEEQCRSMLAGGKPAAGDKPAKKSAARRSVRQTENA
jgi:hypothetical protein